MTRRLIAALAVLGVTLAGAVAAAAVAGNAANHRAASTEAGRILGSLNLPPGAQVSPADPSGGLLAMAVRPRTPALVDRHAFWTVPGEPKDVLIWIEDHPPSGSARDESGAGAGRQGTTTWWDGYSWPAVPGVMGLRQLIVTVAHARSGGTALRADAEVVWTVVRPGTERLPRGVTQIVIKLLGKKPTTVATITSPARVRQVVKLVDRLPLAQPGTRSCPMISGPVVVADFLHGISPKPVAALLAYNSDCVGVEFTVHGQPQPPLGQGQKLIHALGSLTGVKLS